MALHSNPNTTSDLSCRVIVYLNMTFGCGLVLLHKALSMFGKFSVHASVSLGCRFGRTTFYNILSGSLRVKLILAMPRGGKVSLALNEAK